MKMLDTSASNQKRVIIRHFRDSGALDTTYASEQLGIMRLAARVSELRDFGYKIITYRIDTEDITGTKHKKVAKYVLISEPKKEAPTSDQTERDLDNANQ